MESRSRGTREWISEDTIHRWRAFAPLAYALPPLVVLSLLSADPGFMVTVSVCVVITALMPSFLYWRAVSRRSSCGCTPTSTACRSSSRTSQGEREHPRPTVSGLL